MSRLSNYGENNNEYQIEDDDRNAYNQFSQQPYIYKNQILEEEDDDDDDADVEGDQFSGQDEYQEYNNYSSNQQRSLINHLSNSSSAERQHQNNAGLKHHNSVYSSFALMKPGINRLNQKFSPLQNNKRVNTSSGLRNAMQPQFTTNQSGANKQKSNNSSNPSSSLQLSSHQQMQLNQKQDLNVQGQYSYQNFLHGSFNQQMLMQQSMQGVQIERHFDLQVHGASNYVLNLKNQQLTTNPEQFKKFDSLGKSQLKHQKNPILSPDSASAQMINIVNNTHLRNQEPQTMTDQLLTSFFTTTSGKNNDARQVSNSKQKDFMMVIGTQKLQQPNLVMSSEEQSRQQSRESSGSSQRDFINLPFLGQSTQDNFKVNIAQEEVAEGMNKKQLSMKSWDLDDEEIDEFTLQQQQQEAQLKAQQQFENQALPVRKLDFSNLPPGTPPQQTERRQHPDFLGSSRHSNQVNPIDKGIVGKLLQQSESPEIWAAKKGGAVGGGTMLMSHQVNKAQLAAFSQNLLRAAGSSNVEQFKISSHRSQESSKSRQPKSSSREGRPQKLLVDSRVSHNFLPFGLKTNSSRQQIRPQTLQKDQFKTLPVKQDLKKPLSNRGGTTSQLSNRSNSRMQPPSLQKSARGPSSARSNQSNPLLEQMKAKRNSKFGVADSWQQKSSVFSSSLNKSKPDANITQKQAIKRIQSKQQIHFQPRPTNPVATSTRNSQNPSRIEGHPPKSDRSKNGGNITQRRPRTDLRIAVDSSSHRESFNQSVSSYMDHTIKSSQPNTAKNIEKKTLQQSVITKVPVRQSQLLFKNPSRPLLKIKVEAMKKPDTTLFRNSASRLDLHGKPKQQNASQKYGLPLSSRSDRSQGTSSQDSGNIYQQPVQNQVKPLKHGALTALSSVPLEAQTDFHKMMYGSGGSQLFNASISQNQAQQRLKQILPYYVSDEDNQEEEKATIYKAASQGQGSGGSRHNVPPLNKGIPQQSIYIGSKVLTNKSSTLTKQASQSILHQKQSKGSTSFAANKNILGRPAPTSHFLFK